MLEFPRWKTLLVWLVTLFFAVAALPNILPKSALESFPSWWPKQAAPLGLDLRGGSHLLLQLDMQSYMNAHLEEMRDALRVELRKERIGYVGLRTDEKTIQLTLRMETLPENFSFKNMLANVDPTLSITEKDGVTILSYDEKTRSQMQVKLLQQSIEIVNRRINETGTKEPIITRQGTDRIVVQVPGLKDPAQLKTLLGKTAKMNFHLVNEAVALDQVMRGAVPPGTKIVQDDAETFPDGTPVKYALYNSVALSGELLTNANPSYQNGMPVVEFQFNALGARKFGEITSANVGNRFAVVLDNKVITAPVIRSAIMGGRGIIEGNFTAQSANDLAILLRAGALPAPLTIIEERSVGPSLGQDSIEAGTTAAMVGTLLVITFMLLGYGLFGVFANLALMVNLLIILGCLSLMQATLTLPGIAGIVLTMGMAVDANVLIFERIRDEIRNGKSPIAAIDSGFKIAFGTILDSNITTLAAAALLFYFGSGTVKGFAVTLSIGLISSMFTAILFTRMVIVAWAKRTRPKRIPI